MDIKGDFGSQRLLSHASGNAGLSRRRPNIGLALLALVVLGGFQVLLSISNSPSQVLVAPTVQISKNGSWDWVNLSPSRDLQWQECYDAKFDCARLDVPLDWLDPSEDERVVIAVIRLKAKEKKDYRGPMFVNPGGPGGSGVSIIKSHGEKIQAIVGDNYDIVSFDPRGIGASVPRIECWGSAQKRHDWDATEIGVVDAYPGLVYEAFVQNEAYSKQCEIYMNKSTPKLLEHLSTASHARDMLEISEKAGYPKLSYWGFSYGTILGGTFAAMFPDRVERLVSDGNVDYHDWYSLEQINFLEDTDKIMEAFFEFCFKAGPEKCAFYAPGSANVIEARFFALLETLKRSPVAIPAYANGTEPLMPELVTYSKLQLLIRTCLYKMIHRAKDLAEALVALENKNGLPFYNMYNEGSEPATLDFCTADDILPTIPTDTSDGNDAFPAIMCSDGEQYTDPADSFAEYAKTLINISRFAGASNAHFKLSCAGRTVRPKYRFAGPWNTTTAFPILFIGNIADNVTPLLSARNNSGRFPGSVVLVQKSYGHCSLAAPSVCSAKAINAYFQDGTLPAADTYCEQDYEMFQDPPALAIQGREGRLAAAMHDLSRDIKLMHGRTRV